MSEFSASPSGAFPLLSVMLCFEQLVHDLFLLVYRLKRYCVCVGKCSPGSETRGITRRCTDNRN